jgi:NAD(P)-dependent dehydrogenase (short-subunit alcohol dehydrogenase family)
MISTGSRTASAVGFPDRGRPGRPPAGQSGRRTSPPSPSVLITGAASILGAAAAECFVARGFRVFGTRDPRRSDARPEGVMWVGTDVGSEASVRQAVAAVLDHSSRLDAVVCGAGLGAFGRGGDFSIAAAFQQFETSFLGTLRTLRVVLPQLCAQRSGRVVLLGAMAGRAPLPLQVHYAAAKAAIDGLASSLRREARKFGVQVSLVVPADLDLPFERAMVSRREDATPRRDGIGKTGPSLFGLRPEAMVAAIEAAVTVRRARRRYDVLPERFFRSRLARRVSRWRAGRKLDTLPTRG